MSSEPLISLFSSDLQKVVDKYSDEGLTVGEALGAIELLKVGIINDHLDDEDD